MRHHVPRTSIGGDGSPSTPMMPLRGSGSHLVRRRGDPHALHHHFTDVSAAAALSPLLKSKYKTGAGARRVSFGPGGAGAVSAHPTLPHDEKKREEGTDREEKLAQLQQPDPGLEAADRTPTVLRMQAQYATKPNGEPRGIPAALRTGMDAVAAAAAVDAFYTAPFLQLACRAATEREVAARLRGYMKKTTSKLHTVRVEGLKEATLQLMQWATQASVESAERRRDQQQQQQRIDVLYQQYAGAGGVNVSNASSYVGILPDSSLIPGAFILPPYDAVRVEVLGAYSSPADGGGGAGIHGGSHPYNNNRLSTLPSPFSGGVAGKAENFLLARAANAVRSPSWDLIQQALEGVDYTSAIFNTILVPRLEVRNAMSTGMPISIQLTNEMALRWTTLPTPRNPIAAAASDKNTAAAAQHSNDLLLSATAVTFEEQELALRYIQGACLTLYYQRRCCSEGCLIYYATEVFQCMRSHADALFTWQRREQEDQRHHVLNCSSVQDSNKRKGNEEDRTQVAIDPALLRVVVALIEAVEAACHYNPFCLRRLVQTGCVTAMLNLAYCPFMPTPIRSSVLGTISVLLQEVNPLRRYVAAARKPDEGGAAERSTDPLLQRMVDNALHDNPIGHNGKQIPYSTDRGSASKFDSAVRDWFFANGLGNVIPSVMQLQDLRSTFESTSFMIPQGMASAAMGGGGGGAGGVGQGTGANAAAATMVNGSGGGGAAVSSAKPAANLPFASILVSAGPSLRGPLTGRTYSAAAAASGAVSSGAAAVAAAAHANMQREGELYRKRVGRLLECMDGRELH